MPQQEGMLYMMCYTAIGFDCIFSPSDTHCLRFFETVIAVGGHVGWPMTVSVIYMIEQTINIISPPPQRLLVGGVAGTSPECQPPPQ